MTLPQTEPGRRALGAALLAGATLLISACASTPPPREQLAVSRAAVERTSASAAEAPTDAANAREKFERATAAMNNKDYALARQLAEQAEADATLAEANARVARSDRALGELRESIRTLREELSRR